MCGLNGELDLNNKRLPVDCKSSGNEYPCHIRSIGLARRVYLVGFGSHCRGAAWSVLGTSSVLSNICRLGASSFQPFTQALRMWRYQSAKWRLHQGLPCQPRWAEIGMKTGDSTAWAGRPPGPLARYGRC